MLGVPVRPSEMPAQQIEHEAVTVREGAGAAAEGKGDGQPSHAGRELDGHLVLDPGRRAAEELVVER